MNPRRGHIHRLGSLLLVSCLWLSACDNFERDAYRTLKVLKVEYELLQAHAAHAFLAGRLSEAQWEAFVVAGHRFIAAHTLAADLMQTYREVKRIKDPNRRNEIARQAAAALAELPTLLDDLRRLLESFETH